MENNAKMFDSVLETYRCILSCRKKMPGMRLEEAFNDAAVADIELEYEWLLSQQKDGSTKSLESNRKKVRRTCPQQLKPMPRVEDIIKSVVSNRGSMHDVAVTAGINECYRYISRHFGE